MIALFCALTGNNAFGRFELFDGDKSGTLEVFEIIELVEFIYGRSLDDKITRILENMDKDGSGTVSLQEFAKEAKHHPLLLFPAFHTQARAMRVSVSLHSLAHVRPGGHANKGFRREILGEAHQTH